MSDKIRSFESMLKADDTLTAEEWINKFTELTGACGYGARKFIEKKGIRPIDRFTTVQFLEITSGTYHPEIIEELKKYYGV